MMLSRDEKKYNISESSNISLVSYCRVVCGGCEVKIIADLSDGVELVFYAKRSVDPEFIRLLYSE